MLLNVVIGSLGIALLILSALSVAVFWRNSIVELFREDWIAIGIMFVTGILLVSVAWMV